MSVVSPIPPIPESRGYESSGRAQLMPRYEDITQDGRVMLSSLMVGLTAVWRTLADGQRLQGMLRKGILPILNRIVMHGEEGPFSVHTPIHVEGTWRLAKERDGERLFLDMWLDAFAPHGQTHAKQPGPDAERSRVGRIYAEHVVTRPFATTPAERKVTRLENLPGIPEIPENEHAYEDAPSLLRRIAGPDDDHAHAHANAHRLALEPARELAFGMLHTDANQHVNSLVYPRLFEECVAARAMERRLVEHPERLLATAIELRYRKPFFAGERAVIAAAAKAAPRAGADASARAGVDAVGSFVLKDGDPTKPSTTVAMELRPSQAG